MKQRHINLLRAAANILQSSIIQDENIADLKKELVKAYAKKDSDKIDSINWMIDFARKRNKQFLSQYAETIQQLCEQPFTNLLEDAITNELNPLMADIISHHFTPVS